MASSLHLFLALCLLFALSHAREPQSFSKTSAAVDNTVEVDAGKDIHVNSHDSEHTFRPEDTSGYGLDHQVPENHETNDLDRGSQFLDNYSVDRSQRRENPADRFIYDHFNGGAGSSLSSRPQGFYGGGGGGGDRFSGGYSQPQGMSDTRSLDNGRYFYDVNAEKFNSNHPYEVMKAAAEAGENRYGYYGGGYRRSYGGNVYSGVGNQFNPNEVKYGGNW